MSVVFTPDSIIYKFIEYIDKNEIIIHDDIFYNDIIYYAKTFMNSFMNIYINKDWEDNILYLFDSIYNSTNIIDAIKYDNEIIYNFQIICIFILDQFNDSEINTNLTNNMKTLALHIIKNNSNLESNYIKLINKYNSRFDNTIINIGIMQYILHTL